MGLRLAYQRDREPYHTATPLAGTAIVRAYSAANPATFGPGTAFVRVKRNEGQPHYPYPLADRGTGSSMSPDTAIDRILDFFSGSSDRKTRSRRELPTFHKL